MRSRVPKTTPLLPALFRARAPVALAIGACALGALAVGALVVGRLSIGRARIGRLEIGELVVGTLRVTRGGDARSDARPEC